MIQLAKIPSEVSMGYAMCCAARQMLFARPATMTDREAKSRAVKILAKSIYRDLEAQGFDERQIVSLATELISEVTSKMSRSTDSHSHDKSHPNA
jgi:hypothetical protein|nr:hypothetical protein [Kofleriaceae bacterium]